MAETKPPKVFISYAWEDDLKTWVLDFATRLRSDGINAILDQWETVPGDQLPEFMEKSVRESDFVVFVCTPTYKRKSDGGKGGVGYEGHVITGEAFAKNNHRKFIPLLRKGSWKSASPSWATSKLFIDFRENPYSDENYKKLLDTFRHKLPAPPPIGDGNVFTNTENKSVSKPKQTKKSEGEVRSRRKWNTQILVAVIGAVAIILAAIISSLSNNVPSVFAAPTLTATPLSPEMKDREGVLMRLIPSSELLSPMGSNDGNNNEKPMHDVYLRTYYIDVYEVTNAMYRECVKNKICQPPKQKSSQLHSDYYENLQYDKYPVLWVDWYMADTFCSWREARLPTEAEWEKAARGFDSRSYPWGEDLTCVKANYSGCFGDTNPIGLFEEGKSIYGLYNMTGNVAEWVMDWYSETYYQTISPKGVIDPVGPDNGVYKVVRGGSWYTSINGLKVFNRTANSPSYTYNDLGFRCAKSLMP